MSSASPGTDVLPATCHAQELAQPNSELRELPPPSVTGGKGTVKQCVPEEGLTPSLEDFLGAENRF